METLRYVQQFGRSKKDNLKASLISKYHVGMSIEVYPFRIMDFGCFAATEDGLSGLIHNSEMPSVMQANLPELIEKQHPLQVRITKYDRRTGEVAFALGKKEQPEKQESIETTHRSIRDASETKATEQPVDDASAAAAAIETKGTTDLEPYQFATPAPVVYPDKETAAKEPTWDDFVEKEMVDIQKFLENVIQAPLSQPAKAALKKLLQQYSIFRFTYTMQTVVDEFEPDVGMQLVTAIERSLLQQASK
jgi:predicted RNA-binding protein with RPS1 domain